MPRVDRFDVDCLSCLATVGRFPIRAGHVARMSGSWHLAMDANNGAMYALCDFEDARWGWMLRAWAQPLLRAWAQPLLPREIVALEEG